MERSQARLDEPPPDVAEDGDDVRSTGVRYSLWPNYSHAPAEVVDQARWADATGWYGVWYADHYMPNTGTAAVERGDVYECWAMLPAVAAVTERVRVGSLVSPTSVHHPALLANRAATIDHLSGGRMVLGMGAGWQVNEHAAYGIELEPPGLRVSRFEESIQIVRSLLVDERTTFSGSVYTVTDAVADPKPVQSPLPILVGTTGPRMLRIAARYASEWNTWGTPALAKERRRALVEACESVDRDPGTMATSAQAIVHLTGTDSEATRILEGPAGPRAIAGTAERLVDTLGEYADLGFDEFIVPTGNLGDSPGRRRETLERLHADVLSRL